MKTDERNTKGDEQAPSMTCKEKKNLGRTKIASMTRAFILFWRGLTALLVGMANWFTVILGMRDDSTYGKILRRTVATCFCLVVIMLTMGVLYSGGRALYEELPDDVRCGDDYYDARCLSRSVTYYTNYYDDGYLETADGKKTITGIEWIAMPLGTDSLVCYSNGKKRGYFNKFTGRPVIEPKYDHAWIFSDGLASVDDGGWIKFIDASGKVVADPKIPYIPGGDGYVVHENHCVVRDERGDRCGLLDKQGRWSLEPECSSIVFSCKFWIVETEEGKSVLDSALNTVIPFVKGQVWVNSEYISVTLSNHIMQRYDHSGKMVNDFYISDVSCLTYESDELRYGSTKEYDDEGTLCSETEDTEAWPVERMARCRRYEAESGWYGLMSPDGKVLTPPAYCSIRAIGYDLYLCKDNSEDGVILDGKGQPTNE